MQTVIDFDNESSQRRRKSALLTALILSACLVICFFTVVVHTTNPPPHITEYELTGAIDYGDWNEGSQNINTFEKSSANPDPAKPAPKAPAPAEKPVTEVPDDKEELTDPDPEEETVPVKEPVRPKKPEKSEKTEKTTPPKSENAKGGANHGNTPGGVGNRGTPDYPILDPNGLFEFGSGADGLRGRKPISTPAPKYRVQQETRLTFEFVIAPKGNVKSVRPVKLGSAPALVKAAKEAIMKWKFNAISTENDQKCKVTFTFKLK